MSASDELIRLTATEAVARLRRREITPHADAAVLAAAALLEGEFGIASRLPIDPIGTANPSPAPNARTTA